MNFSYLKDFSQGLDFWELDLQEPSYQANNILKFDPEEDQRVIDLFVEQYWDPRLILLHDLNYQGFAFYVVEITKNKRNGTKIHQVQSTSKTLETLMETFGLLEPNMEVWGIFGSGSRPTNILGQPPVLQKAFTLNPPDNIDGLKWESDVYKKLKKVFDEAYFLTNLIIRGKSSSDHQPYQYILSFDSRFAPSAEMDILMVATPSHVTSRIRYLKDEEFIDIT